MPVSFDDFDRASELLAHLVAAGACHVVVLVPAGRQYVQFVYDPSREPVRVALDSANLTARDLAEAAGDIGEALSAAAEDVSDEIFVAGRTRPRDAEPEPGEVALRKLELVRNRFDIPDLRRRIWLKRTSKSRIPLTLDWEVNSKRMDGDVATPPGGPVLYATVVLRTSWATRPLFLDSIPDLPIDLDRQDVDVLIGFLQKLRQALADAEDLGAA